MAPLLVWLGKPTVLIRRIRGRRDQQPSGKGRVGTTEVVTPPVGPAVSLSWTVVDDRLGVDQDTRGDIKTVPISVALHVFDCRLGTVTVAHLLPAPPACLPIFSNVRPGNAPAADDPWVCEIGYNRRTYSEDTS
jgi:hypothetical protein